MGKTYNGNNKVKNGKIEWNRMPHSKRKRVRKMKDNYDEPIEEIVDALNKTDEKDEDIISNAFFNGTVYFYLGILIFIWILKCFNIFTLGILIILFLFSSFYTAVHAFTFTKRRYKR